ncbi:MULTISPECIES: hypothetical protein [Moorena]|uniref:Uncharacterized protein n=1 Tax=Moorena bouillonii PNG TaxID=568701 RepID=A0A1U7N0Z7_9CYAN|nr:MULTISPECIES: hypothetical protein [Moorena]NEO44705.1 hypothetical protein [Moorena sp. SIO4A3]NEQ63212.1 hypothetical protein [Moorena sp. SIO4A1]OLT59591.1 hypothetical protein BJP37_11690 [Moorena bouillonii PNG]
MSNKEMFKTIASEVQLFQDMGQKENFIFVIGALVSRLISLQKAAEIMQIEPEVFIKILDLMGIEFSYLSSEDITIEQNW